MKNKLIYLQTTVALAGAGLLYQSSWGVNAFLVSLLVLCLLAAVRRLSMLPALLFALAGLLVAVNAATISMVLYWLLLMILISNTQGRISWSAAIPDGISRLIKGGWLVIGSQKQRIVPGFSLSKGLLMILPPLGITLIFYALYANASPAFASKVSLAGLDLPTPGWFLLFIALLYGSFSLAYVLPVSKLQLWDARQPDVLLRIRKKYCLNPFWLKYEYKTAVTALVSLNVLLLLFHTVDLISLFEGKPGNITYSEWVHQGVGALILSILMAVALLVYVFRGNLNFFQQNHSLKLGAKAWIIQNALLVFTTALKNSWYIASWGLTYRRIGVWVYLLLVLIGLFTTWMKIQQKQTLWWMIKGNFKAAVLVLLLVAAFPWARIITWYNLHEVPNRDEYYLFHLPIHNTDQLLPYQHSFMEKHQEALQGRIVQLEQSTEKNHWKSWNLLNYYAAQNLEKAN
ncbi:MAG: DUF4173 domain-containing protein [Bacteroidetes bacterium]|nr:DUF4173 domain-containing protein [Bacteroidota bacterium]